MVAEAFVAESIEVDRAKRAVDALRLSERGVTVSYTDPLSGSSLCASLVAAKTLAVAGDTASCGVVLVGQAQPIERSRVADTFDHQESGFLNQVRMLLIERGLLEQRVHIAWADWRSPEVTGSVRHFAALGCRTVVVVPGMLPSRLDHHHARPAALGATGARGPERAGSHLARMARRPGTGGSAARKGARQHSR